MQIVEEQRRQHTAWVEARRRLSGGMAAPKALPVVRTSVPTPLRTIAPMPPVQIEVTRPRDWLIIPRRSVGRQLPSTIFIHEPIWLPIAREVCAEFSVSLNEIKSARRSKYVTIPRQKLAWRLKKETPMTIAQIGRVIRRDHTTVIHSIARHEQRMRDAQQ